MSDAFLDSLAPPDPRWQSTGGQKLPYDWRDFQAARHPSIAAMLATYPDRSSLRKYHTGPPLNQNGFGACAAASPCSMQALYEQKERKRWMNFDWFRLYRENGGPEDGSRGIYSRDVLHDMQERGCPIVGSEQRYKIGSYAFVDFGDFDLAIDTVKAAIAVERPVVIALLLPTDFSIGKHSGQASSQVTSGYHAMMAGEYEPGEIGYLNSWGAWGDNGWGSVTIDFLRRPEQRGYLYAFTTFDAQDTDVDPEPNPDPFDPSKSPVLVRAKYKADARKVVLTGSNFSESALVTVDGAQIATQWHDSSWMTGKRLALASGTHVASVRNLAGGASSTKEFQV